MKTHLLIDGRHYFYDLCRLKGWKSLKKDDELITTNHLNYKPCRVRVDCVTQDYVMVELVRERPTNIYWRLTKNDFVRGVYLIEKEEKSQGYGT